MKTKTADKLPNMHSTEFRGIPVVIEWPKGSTRVGERKDGTPFKTEMVADYGYIPDTVAAGDEERLDVYIGDDKESDTVYAVEQVRKPYGEFDEYKLMLGFSSLEEAEEAYLKQLGDDADVEMDDISEIPFDYLFDRVMQEREEDKVQEIEETRTEIVRDLDKVADHDRMSVIDAFVKLYKKEVDFYEETARHVAESLEEALQEAGIKAAVTHRAKRPRKLRMKLQKRDQKRHYQSFRDIYNDIVDLAGVRVALYLPADREAVGQIIEKLFASVREPKQFPEASQPEEGDTLGYIATHYLVQLRPENLHKDELRYADTNIEIQVASVLMHAWSEITHDLIYKPEKGTLTPEEHKMIGDLNKIVQVGEQTLERLQQSMENRSGKDLRFELAAALAKKLAIQSAGKATKRITASDVRALAKAAVDADVSGELTYYLKQLGWKHHGFNEWTPGSNRPQDIMEVFHDGWIHRSWGKIVGSGDTLSEMQTHLQSAGLGQPMRSVHGSYLAARIAIWKAHRADADDDRLRTLWEQQGIKRTTGQDDPFLNAARQQLGFAPEQTLTSDQSSQLLQLAQKLKTNPQP
jgi:ppGpp synthetase/RelA/SpoT-type nucleotidyltranferase